MRIARVFPRKTKATPDDELTYFNGPGDPPPEVDEVHISVAFTWDKDRAEQLAEKWEHVAPVKIGGPAYGDKLGEFEPGIYIKNGYTITSRGCPNAKKGKCWFCTEPPGPVELEIKDGWNVLDPNILSTSEEHFKKVVEMLKRQDRRAEFTGGLEAKLLTPWHVDLLRELKPKQMFFAYDTPDDLEPLVKAGKMLLDAGFTTASHTLRCYCLIGYRGDTFDKAEKRLEQAIDAGFMPMAMLYRGEDGNCCEDWKPFQREWARPAIVGKKMKERRCRKNERQG